MKAYLKVIKLWVCIISITCYNYILFKGTAIMCHHRNTKMKFCLKVIWVYNFCNLFVITFYLLPRTQIMFHHRNSDEVEGDMGM